MYLNKLAARFVMLEYPNRPMYHPMTRIYPKMHNFDMSGPALQSTLIDFRRCVHDHSFKKLLNDSPKTHGKVR